MDAAGAALSGRDHAGGDADERLGGTDVVGKTEFASSQRSS
jgi:hypothetical protein